MRRRGFTLIEVLLAVALGVTILALAAQVFASALNGRVRLQEQNLSASSLRRAYETISRDMHSAIVPPDDSGLQFGISGNITGNTRDVLQMAAVVGEPLMAGRAANETSLVQYAIAPDPDTGRSTFWRYETPYPLPEGGSIESDPSTRAIPLLVGVEDATYTFFSASQSNWIQTWDGETGLPTAIRVDLAFEPTEQKNGKTVTARTESWIFQLPAAGFANDEVEKAAAEAETGTSDTGTTGATDAGGGQ